MLVNIDTIVSKVPPTHKSIATKAVQFARDNNLVVDENRTPVITAYAVDGFSKADFGTLLQIVRDSFTETTARATIAAVDHVLGTKAPKAPEKVTWETFSTYLRNLNNSKEFTRAAALAISTKIVADKSNSAPAMGSVATKPTDNSTVSVVADSKPENTKKSSKASKKANDAAVDAPEAVPLVATAEPATPTLENTVKGSAQRLATVLTSSAEMLAVLLGCSPADVLRDAAELTLVERIDKRL